MATNYLAKPWDFETPNINAFFQPVQQGIDRYNKQTQVYEENRRADEQLGMQRERLGLEKSREGRATEAEQVKKIGQLAQVVLSETDPNKQRILGQQLMASHPEMANTLAKYQVDPNDHVTAAKFLSAQAGLYDPLGEEAKRAQIASSQASTNLHNVQAGNAGKTSGIQEFEYAKKSGYTGSFQDWQKDAQNASTKYGLNPIPYQKPDGSIGYMVPSTSGQTRDLEIPGAGKAMPKVADVQTPTEVITRDQFGNIIRRERKDIAGKEAQEEVGKAAGKAQVDLPTAETNAQSILRALDEAESAIDATPRMTGWTGNLPNVTPAARDAQAKIDQVQGKAFLQQFNGLRGGGAITEAEGAKATAAMSRLQETRVGTPEYKKALADVRTEVRALLDLARRKAGARSPTPAPSPAAQPASGGWGIRRLD